MKFKKIGYFANFFYELLCGTQLLINLFCFNIYLCNRREQSHNSDMSGFSSAVS